MENEEKMEVYCPSCEKVGATLAFEMTEQDQPLSCSACNTRFYWHSCPDCGTGWTDLEQKRECFECQ